MKVCGSTVKLQLILGVLSTVEAGGIRGVAVSYTHLDGIVLPHGRTIKGFRSSMGMRSIRLLAG